MQILVETLTEEIISIYCQPFETIEQFKHKIFNKVGTPVNQQRLIFRGRQLENGRTIADYDIRDEDTISLVLALCGGSMATLQFNSMENQVLQDFVTSAPRYRRVIKGLNLEGKCKNNRCEAYNNRAWCQRGFGEFHMNEETYNAKCPLCSNILEEVNNCGFTGCSYSIRGMKRTNGGREEVNKGPIRVPNDKLLTFRDSNDDIADWLYLVISVSR